MPRHVLKGSTHEVSRDEGPLCSLVLIFIEIFLARIFQVQLHFSCGARFCACMAMFGTSNNIAQMCCALSKTSGWPRKCFKLLVHDYMDGKGVRLGVSWTGSHATKIGRMDQMVLSTSLQIVLLTSICFYWRTTVLYSTYPTRSLRASCFIQCLSSVSSLCHASKLMCMW